MGELATSPPPTAVLPVVFVDGDQSVDLGTVTVQPSLAVRKLQAVVADRVGVAPQQISAFLARPRRARRVPLDEGTDLAAAVAREGSGCYVLAALRRSRRERRGGRSRREKKAAAATANAAVPSAPPPERTILKRLPPTDLASLAASPRAGDVRGLGIRGAAARAAAAARLVPHAHGGGPVHPAHAGARGPASVVPAAPLAAGDALLLPRVRGGCRGHAPAGLPPVRARPGDGRLPVAGGPNRAPSQEVPLAAADVRWDDARLLAVN